MTFKQKIYLACKQALQEKAAALTAELLSLSEAANTETKSSAGDKHETSRAMIQLEQEKIGKLLKEAREQVTELEKSALPAKPTEITTGTLIKTDKNYFFLGPAIGKIEVDGETVIVLSPLSPLGKKLIGLKENDSVEVNGIKYLIRKLY